MCRDTHTYCACSSVSHYIVPLVKWRAYRVCKHCSLICQLTRGVIQPSIVTRVGASEGHAATFAVGRGEVAHHHIARLLHYSLRRSSIGYANNDPTETFERALKEKTCMCK